MANLNTRYPNLYLTPNCAFCNQYENTYHILSCTLHSINLYEILLNQITNTLNILNLNNTLSQTIFQIINHNNNSQNLINILLLFIQGIILTTHYDQINSLLKKTTNNFFIKLSNSLLLWFNAKIWNSRNQIHHEWEIARGISQKTKKNNTNQIHLPQFIPTQTTTTTYNSNIDTYIQKCLLQNFSIYNCFF